MRANFLSDALSHTARLIHPMSLERLDVLGPTIQFVTDPAEEDAPCIMRGTVPPGVSIPLHSHADPETFLPLSGSFEASPFMVKSSSGSRSDPAPSSTFLEERSMPFETMARKRP